MDKLRLRIVLVAPRIAANVGNIARTVRSLGGELHLVGPLGFILDAKKAKRASVGYWEDLEPTIYRDHLDFWERFSRSPETGFFWATIHGKQVYTQVNYPSDTVLIFGNEEEGVDPVFWKTESLPSISSCRIPMQNVRCLNLATSVGIVGYEVFRQWTQVVSTSENQVTSSFWL